MVNKYLPGVLENIFVNAPIGIFTTDLNRVITMANRLVAQIHGLKNGDELIGKTFPNAICRSSRIVKKLKEVMDGTVDRANIEYKVSDNDDKKTIRLVSSLLRDEQYTPIGLLNMCEDITTEKKLAEQVENYTRNLKKMVKEKTAELKTANRQLIKSEKSRVLSNPLSSLKYLMSEIEESTSESNIKKPVKLCLGEIDRIRRLLYRLRESFCSADDEKCLVNLNQLLEDTLLMNRVYFFHKNIRVEKQLDTELPSLVVFVDQIKQVFMNLIINAVDSMPDGGQLKISTRPKKQKVLIKFTDTGVGIPSENLDKVFAPFFTTKPNTTGLGLGLSVSNQIIIAHKGKLWVESENGIGASFFIALPIKNPEGR
jgi:PAS domain S-box-containing protein